MKSELYTDGKVTIYATEKAFDVIYKKQGFWKRKTPLRKPKEGDK